MNVVLKKIIPRVILLLFPFFLYYICYMQYLINERKFKTDADMVYKALDKSKVKTKKKKIIFGDSVGSQLFSPYEDADSVYSMCTTGPSGIVGVYVLLNNFIAANETQGKDFYYVATPHAFASQLKTKYTYNHFVKPFYTWGNRRYFTPSVNDSIHAIPYWYAAQLPFIKISDFQPAYNFTCDTVFSIIPSVAVDYLKLIDSVAKQNHLNFHFVMPFIDERFRDEDHAYLRNIINQNGLNNIFAGYFENEKFLPDSEFKPDHHHYLNPQKIKTYSVGI
jgi:hypothetical protein